MSIRSPLITFSAIPRPVAPTPLLALAFSRYIFWLLAVTLLLGLLFTGGSVAACPPLAQRLLLHSNLNVSQIGYRLGFDDPSYFVKYFKKYTTISPMDFRKSIA